MLNCENYGIPPKFRGFQIFNCVENSAIGTLKRVADFFRVTVFLPSLLAGNRLNSINFPFKTTVQIGIVQLFFFKEVFVFNILIQEC